MLPPTATQVHAADHETRTRRFASLQPSRTAARASQHGGRPVAPRPEQHRTLPAVTRYAAPVTRRAATPRVTASGPNAHQIERAARRALAGGGGIGAAVTACRPDWMTGESRWTAIVSDGDAHRFVEVRSREIKPWQRLLPSVIEEGIERVAAALPDSHRLHHLINACPLHMAADGTVFD